MSSQGKIDGSQFQRCASPNEDIAELVSSNDSDQAPLAFSEGLKLGDGEAGNYPVALQDGIFLAPSDELDVYDSSGKRDAMRIGSDGLEVYNIPANGDVPILYVVWTNGCIKITGADNRFHTFNEAVDPFTPVFAGSPTKPTVNANWKAAFGSHSATGFTGSVRMWIPESLTNEVDISGYAKGDRLTIINGRIAVASSTDIDRGSVERIDSSGTYPKILANLYLNGPRVAVA